MAGGSSSARTLRLGREVGILRQSESGMGQELNFAYVGEEASTDAEHAHVFLRGTGSVEFDLEHSVRVRRVRSFRRIQDELAVVGCRVRSAKELARLTFVCVFQQT